MKSKIRFRFRFRFALVGLFSVVPHDYTPINDRGVIQIRILPYLIQRRTWRVTVFIYTINQASYAIGEFLAEGAYGFCLKPSSQFRSGSVLYKDSGFASVR